MRGNAKKRGKLGGAFAPPSLLLVERFVGFSQSMPWIFTKSHAPVSVLAVFMKAESRLASPMSSKEISPEMPE